MQDLELYTTLLGLQAPWCVTDATLYADREEVEIRVELRGQACCPRCSQPAATYDHRRRRWRHLDLFQYRAYVEADVPRVSCREHGVLQVAVPWAESRSGFTAMFERLAIALLSAMPIATAARQLALSWDQVDSIMAAAVARGLQRRTTRVIPHLGIDEKSIKRRYKFFTVVTDLDRGEVVWVGRGRKRDTLDAFWAGLSKEQLAGIEGIAMDMAEPFIQSTLTHVPDAARKIVFDKFHLMHQLVHAVDLTRRAEVRHLGSAGATLKGTRYSWVRNPAGMDRKTRVLLRQLRHDYTKLGRAWAIKEAFTQLWRYQRTSAARAFFQHWYGWAVRARLPLIAKVARTFRRYLENILTYVTLRITNATSEGLNSKIQWIKYQARGFRNEDRFERAIMFHCAGLDLAPTHTNA